MKKHTAFTLIELLVVIAIIGMLITLLLPAIQAAREAARKMSCFNNLHQISIGLHSHYATNEAFPFGHTGYRGLPKPTPYKGNQASWKNPTNDGSGLPNNCVNADIGKESGWSLYILPFIEQTAVWDAYDDDLWIDHPNNRQAVQTTIPVFLCPSTQNEKPLTQPFGTVNGFQCARLHYAGLQASILNITAAYSSFFQNRTFKDSGLNGMLYWQSAADDGKQPVSMVEDGFSNTMTVTEDVTFDDGAWASGRSIFQLTNYHVFSGTPSVRIPLNNLHDKTSNADVAKGNNGFHADHVAGLNGAFADGSAHFLNDNIDAWILRCLVNRMDGETVSLP
ncbi:MAG: DUF1559 domain-containing protein [Planctomycetaceae bacterium]|jgi:prepilin-type N-terminal cleavage/methylation domain-containing protein|nr:DUF1559 domain-containing protein [Planctomycetaceae bacterium]